MPDPAPSPTTAMGARREKSTSSSSRGSAGDAGMSNGTGAMAQASCAKDTSSPCRRCSHHHRCSSKACTGTGQRHPQLKAGCEPRGGGGSSSPCRGFAHTQGPSMGFLPKSIPWVLSVPRDGHSRHGGVATLANGPARTWGTPRGC